VEEEGSKWFFQVFKRDPKGKFCAGVVVYALIVIIGVLEHRCFKNWRIWGSGIGISGQLELI
jgi:hypothetical protein